MTDPTVRRELCRAISAYLDLLPPHDEWCELNTANHYRECDCHIAAIREALTVLEIPPDATVSKP